MKMFSKSTHKCDEMLDVLRGHTEGLKEKYNEVVGVPFSRGQQSSSTPSSTYRCEGVSKHG